jgi:hypothetical protein
MVNSRERRWTPPPYILFSHPPSPKMLFVSNAKGTEKRRRSNLKEKFSKSTKKEEVMIRYLFLPR